MLAAVGTWGTVKRKMFLLVLKRVRQKQNIVWPTQGRVATGEDLGEDHVLVVGSG